MGEYTIIDGNTFTVENSQPYLGELKLKTNLDYTGFNSNILILDFGKLKRQGSVSANLIFKNKLDFKDINIIACSGSCGCTVGTFRKLEDGSFLVTVNVSLGNMSFGDNSKILKITMSDRRVMKIEVKVNGL